MLNYGVWVTIRRPLRKKGKEETGPGRGRRQLRPAGLASTYYAILLWFLPLVFFHSERDFLNVWWGETCSQNTISLPSLLVSSPTGRCQYAFKLDSKKCRQP